MSSLRRRPLDLNLDEVATSRLTPKSYVLTWPRDNEMGMSRATSFRVASQDMKPTHSDTPARIMAIAIRRVDMAIVDALAASVDRYRRRMCTAPR